MSAHPSNDGNPGNPAKESAGAVYANPFDALKGGVLSPLYDRPGDLPVSTPTVSPLGNPFHFRSGSHPLSINPDAPVFGDEFIQRAVVKPMQQNFAQLLSVTGTPNQWKEAVSQLRDALSGKPLTSEQVARVRDGYVTREKMEGSRDAILATGSASARILSDFAKDPKSEWNKRADIIAKEDPALGRTLRKIGDGRALDAKDYEILAGEIAGQFLPDMMADGALKVVGRIGAHSSGADPAVPKRSGQQTSVNEVQTINYRPDPGNPGAYVPDLPEVSRTHLPAGEQASLMARALSVEGLLSGHLGHEITAWSARTGGKIEHLYGSPGVLYGNTPQNAGLIGEAMLDASRIPEGQRKAAHIVLANVRDNIADRSGKALADLYESMLPGQANHAEFKRRVAEYDQLLDTAVAGERRLTPEGRQTLPAQEQAVLLIDRYGVEGKLAPSLQREIVEWANGRPKNAIENLATSGAELFGDGTATAQRRRVNGVAGEALAELLATSSNRAAVDSVIGDIRAEAAASGLDGRMLMATYADIATPGTQNRIAFDARVAERHLELQEQRSGVQEVHRGVPLDQQARQPVQGSGVKEAIVENPRSGFEGSWSYEKSGNSIDQSRKSSDIDRDKPAAVAEKPHASAESDADSREAHVIGKISKLKGQSVAYTPRFSTHHDLTGEGVGVYTTISGHGVLEIDSVVSKIGNIVQRDDFTIPEGVNLYFLGLPGGTITDRLGQRADVGGDLTGVPLMKLGAGDTAPDILITPDFGTIKIQGNPIRVDNLQGVRLSQLIRDLDLSGNIVVSTCLQQSVSHGKLEHWQGITFDLPDRYPKPAPPDLSGLPPRMPIDPDFNTQHGLTSSGKGQYTAIGGNAGLSGVNPFTKIPFQEQAFKVPEGVTVYFSALPGGRVHNRLAETIEKGEDLSRIPLLKMGAGSMAPDPLLVPGFYEVSGNFIEVSDRKGQRLSELIREHGLTGNVVVAGGLEGRNKPHSNVLFDLPEGYSQKNAKGGARGIDLTMEQVIKVPTHDLKPAVPAVDDRRSSMPPQPGDGAYTAYQHSRAAVDRLNAEYGITNGESSERLVVAAAVAALRHNLRVDEVAFNLPTATSAQASTAFVIERSVNGVHDRYAAVSVEEALRMNLVQGYSQLHQIDDVTRNSSMENKTSLEEVQSPSGRRLV